jgi:hypothetical protein
MPWSRPGASGSPQPYSITSSAPVQRVMRCLANSSARLEASCEHDIEIATQDFVILL